MDETIEGHNYAAPRRSFAEAIKVCCASGFKGRASRSEFLWFCLLSFIILALLHTANYIIRSADVWYIIQLFLMIIFYGVLLLLYAAGARRLHDTGHSGWWQLLIFLPEVIGKNLSSSYWQGIVGFVGLGGIVLFIYCGAKKGNPNRNKYDIAYFKSMNREPRKKHEPGKIRAFVSSASGFFFVPVFGLAGVSIYAGYLLGHFYLLWLAFQMGSFSLFSVTLFGIWFFPIGLPASIVGIYALIYDTPRWVINWFG